MRPDILQALLAIFGVVYVLMAGGHNPTTRKWAPIVGLAGQPFWAMFAWSAGAWGLGITVSMFTAAYLASAWQQWRPRRPEELPPEPDAFENLIRALDRHATKKDAHS